MFGEYLYLGFLLLLGLVALSKGSDWLTDSIAPLAKKMGTSRSAVSIILVSIMVSLPEILVALIATWMGHPVIGLGVIFGSILCNIGLMTGLNGFLKPIHVERAIIVRDGVFSVVFAVVVMAIGYDGVISRFEGLALFLLFIPYIITVWEDERLKSAELREKDLKQTMVELDMIGLQFGKMRAGVLTFVLGAALLLVGSQLFADAMTRIAESSGISDLIIGLTLGAIGPSIPNIVAAYKAGQRGMDNVVVSETLGSNIFTLLVTLGLLSLVAPITLDPRWIRFDIPVMVIMSFALLIFLVTRRRISRLEGGILFFGYLGVLLMQVLLYS
ncbi:TPA: calcium/sodium antiporter [Candidatus Woesearchaeota archaeon]|nr:calcium/sodium antiporter [Candidatus Woesearchaeota archaeon]